MVMPWLRPSDSELVDADVPVHPVIPASAALTTHTASTALAFLMAQTACIALAALAARGTITATRAVHALSASRAVLMILVVLTLYCGILSAATTVQPGITLNTTEDSIYLGDSIVVEIEAVGLTEELDVQPLFKGADLLRETTGTRIAVIEGKVVEVKLRRMEFLPRQQGLTLFGPLEGSSIKGPVISNSLPVKVLPPAETDWQPAGDDLQAELTLSTREPYIGQHLVADITLKHRHPIADESLSLPDFDGFDVVPQFEQRRTIQATDDDPSWRVIAWRYHLYPRRSGELSIGGIQWSGTVIRSRTQRADFERRASPVTLDVRPASTVDSWWLPATRVALSDSWSADPRELSAGDEIIRTITLEADDVLASHLPNVVPLESRALSTTLIRQDRTDTRRGETNVATAVFEFRMIAQSPIPVFLDTVRVPWFDTRDERNTEAIIPARRINVGLPERADLLAEIAMNDSWLDKWQLAVRGSIARMIPWHYTLAVLSLLAIVLWYREMIARRHLLARRRKGTLTGSLPEL